MPNLFADTSGWGNLVDPTQPLHSFAASLYRSRRQHGDTIITTNYVLVELVALLTSPLRIPRSTTIAFLEGRKASPYIEVIHVDASLDEQAWQLHMSRHDNEWS